jgi:hypothetical protein
MDRRKFLQTAGIALGALALPPVAQTSLSAPRLTDRQLVEKLQQECYEAGDPNSLYDGMTFTIPIGTRIQIGKNEFIELVGRDDGHVYLREI